MSSTDHSDYFKPIVEAFDADGYDVVATFEYEGARGVSARHRTALNCGGPDTKAAYYLEGEPYAMGYLMGRLAEPAVEAMAIDFTAKCIPAFVNPDLAPARFEFVFKWLVDLIGKADESMMPDIPAYLIEEMRGLVNGCRAANPETQVDWKHVFTLNVAIDFLCTAVYAPNALIHGNHGITAEDLNTPVFCNAFAAFNGATKSGKDFFYGRDFMFPSSGVFQYRAAHVIRVPHETEGEFGLPFVSVNAPGWVGSIAAMNAAGVSAGVDMVPAACVDHSRPGFNSLGLVRDVVEHCAGAYDAVERMVVAHRGCSWLYSIADAKHDVACIVEAGFTTESLEPLQYPEEAYRALLPDAKGLEANETIEPQEGLMVRHPNYEVPDYFLGFNAGLFGADDKPYGSAMFDERGTLGDNVIGPKFNGAYYFSKVNLPFEDAIATTNTFMIPTMRLTSMAKWTQLAAGRQWNDCQWRYGALTGLIREHHGDIDAALAQKIIDLLGPEGFYPNYYRHEWKGDAPDWRTEVIQGSTSIFDLRNKTVKTHWGWFGDPWAELDLTNYLGV